MNPFRALSAALRRSRRHSSRLPAGQGRPQGHRSPAAVRHAAWTVAESLETRTLLSSAPVNVSITPSSSGSDVGDYQTFTAVYSDADGATNLDTVWLMAQNSTSGQFSLFVYNRQYDVMTLYNDANTGGLGDHTPWTAGVIENGYFALDCSGTGPTVSGNNLTMTWRVAAKTPGDRTLNLFSADANSLYDGYDALGTWHVTV